MQAHPITQLLRVAPELARAEIEKIREKHGKTAEAVALATGVSVRTVRRWLAETGLSHPAKGDNNRH
jgi:DNA-binding transcriptional regulator YiaG